MNDKEIEQLSKMKFVKEVYPEPTQTAINNIDDRINEVNRHFEQKVNELIKTPYSEIEMDSLVFSYNAEIIPLSKAKDELMIHSAPIRFYKEVER